MTLPPSFTRYWRASAVSAFGSYVTLFALQALVVETLDGSAADVGLVNSARWLPFLVVGVAVGAIVDGRRRLPMIVASDLLQAALLLLIPLLWALDALSLASLLGVVVAYGTVNVVGSAASMSLLPRLVSRADLQPAHARIDSADAVASTSAPALAGVLVSVIGAPLTIVLDAASYLYSALTVRRIVVDEPPSRSGVTVRALLTDVRDGFGWAYRRSGLAALAVTTHGWFVGHAVVGAVLAVFVLDTLDLSPLWFGVVGAAGGVGAVMGAGVTTAAGRRLGIGPTIVVCRALSALGVLVTVAAPASPHWTAIAVVAAGQLVYGVAMGMSNSHEMAYRQLLTPDAFQARTNTTQRSVNRGVIVVVAPLAGLLADAVGPRPALLGAAGVFGVVTIALALSPVAATRDLVAQEP